MKIDEAKFAKKLGRHVAKVRAARAYSQDKLCLEGSFSRGTIHKIENGKVSVGIYTLARIAKILKIPLKELIDFE